MSIWGLSTFHILLIKSDKHTNHLEKKKNVKNMKINFYGNSLTYDRYSTSVPDSRLPAKLLLPAFI